VRRNVQWLKKRTQNEYDDYVKFENNESNTETVNNETENKNNESDTVTVNNETENENIENGTETVNNETENENEIANDGVKRTKRGRVIKRPKRYLLLINVSKYLNI